MINNQLKQKISDSLSQNVSVVAAYVLGSFAQVNAGAESDFDLAVVVDKKQSGIFEKIYELLKDIQFPKNLDLSVVDHSSSPLFLFQIVSKGVRLYEKNRSDMVRFEAFVLHNYYDTGHIRAMYAENLKEKFSHTTYVN